MTRSWLRAWGLTAIAFGGASLIVPLYVVELGGGSFELGLLFATGSFIGVPGALLFGSLADRTGKRRSFVLLAMAVTTLTMSVIPILDSIPMIIVVNAMLWFGFAAAVPVLTLLAVSGEPEETWSSLIASLNKFQGIGWAGGLALGFVLITVATQYIETVSAQRLFFLTCSVLAASGLVLGFKTIPSDSASAREPSPRRLQRSLRRVTRFNVRGAAFPFTPGRFDPRQLHPRRFLDRFSRPLGLYFGAILLVFIGFGIFFAPLPIYLDTRGFDSSEIFGLYLLLNTGAAVFFGRSALLSDRFGVFRTHAAGLLVRGLSFPLVALTGILVGSRLVGGAILGVLFVIVGFSWAVIAVTAVTLVTKLAPPAIRGEAFGVYGALVAVGGGIGGLVGGSLAGLSFLGTFGVAGGIVILGVAIVVYILNSASANGDGMNVLLSEKRIEEKSLETTTKQGSSEFQTGSDGE